MKLTLSWLEDHLETSASLARIADALTRIGLEVEGVEDARNLPISPKLAKLGERRF
jgi:phenylalanyl-tRNA synthetase beta chain